VADAVIDMRELRKSFDGVRALDGLSLTVPRGSIYALLGPNGAGKTTAIKILLGLVHATSGTARVFDLPVDSPEASVEIRRRTALVTEDKDLFDTITVGEIVRFTSRAVRSWRGELASQYLKMFDLDAGRRIRTLSRGARTKLALLLALCRRCELLILDEPTAGLDPAAIEQLLQAVVHHVAADGVTVCFSSHQLSEVEQIADHIAIVNRGRAVLTGALDDLRADCRRIQLVFDTDAPSVTFQAPGVTRIARGGRVLSVFVRAGADAVIEEARAWNPTSVEVVPLTLKDIFLEAVNTEC